jgi:nitrilase
VVLSANQCITKSNIPAWITENEAGGKGVGSETNGTYPPFFLKSRRKSMITDDGNEIALPGPKEDSSEVALDSSPTKKLPDEYVSRGGSCIVSPLGDVIAGPLWDDENGLLIVDVDFDDCLRGRLDLDVGGSYSR